MSAAPPLWNPADPVSSWDARVDWLVSCTPDAPLERAARLLEALRAVPGWAEQCAVWSTRLAQRQQPAAPRIVLTGDPKAGRSTLLNALLARPILRTAVRACTTVPTTVFACGARFTEVPPGTIGSPGDARILVVDVRQPLPRALRLVPADGGPTVLLLTKVDRAREDADLSSDPEAEVKEALDVARRRADARTEGGLAAVLVCDPRDARAVRQTVWPALRRALAPAWTQAEARRLVEDQRFVAALARSLRPPEPMDWPPQIPVTSAARDILQAGVAVAMASVSADESAWRARVRQVDVHDELDHLVARIPEALDDIGDRAVERATHACVQALQNWAEAFGKVLVAAAPWVAEDDLVVPVPAVSLGVAGGALARGQAERVQAAAPLPLLGMVRLRRVDSRRMALDAAWSDALADVQIDLGAALRDCVTVVEDVVRVVGLACIAAAEARGRVGRAAEARRRTAQQVALLRAREWLLGEEHPGQSAHAPRTL